MFNWLWNWKRAPGADRKARAELKRLFQNLSFETDRQIIALYETAGCPVQLGTLFRPLNIVATARAEVAMALRTPCEGQATSTVTLVCQLSKVVTESLNAEPCENIDARQALSRTLQCLLAAQKAISPAVAAMPSLAKKRRIVMSKELLEESYYSLFPAERMLVAAGRHLGDATRLIKIYDVTGDQSGGHVRANPDLLGRALIEMDKSDTFLAAWLHSHPGATQGTTHPSSIDLEQDQDWIRDYPRLLNVIVVKDRWFRFWGTALESGLIEVELLGHGPISEKKHGYIYRLDERRLPDEPGDANPAHRDRDGTPVAPEA